MNQRINTYLKANFWLMAVIISVFAVGIIAVTFMSRKYASIFVYILTAIFILILIITVIFNLIITNAVKVNNIKKRLSPIIKPFVTIFYPLLSTVSQIFKIDKKQLRLFFIEINNVLVRSMHLKYKSEDILLLAPHCLQSSACNVKITNQPANCKSCGECNIKDLVELSKKYNTKLSVVTGGTLARKVIKEFKPRFIISIACERDLISGIMDVYHIPVIGVLNSCPYGPCFNTKVNINDIENAMIEVLM